MNEKLTPVLKFRKFGWDKNTVKLLLVVRFEIRNVFFWTSQCAPAQEVLLILQKTVVGADAIVPGLRETG
jgi:hypothetical protein